MLLFGVRAPQATKDFTIPYSFKLKSVLFIYVTFLVLGKAREFEILVYRHV